MDEIILEMKEISKTFPGVRALDRVSFSCVKGEVHALVGENGAGKSTLVKILAGVHELDSGEIAFKGKIVHFSSPLDAQRAGISIIYQELNLLPHMTVAANIALGREPQHRFGLLDERTMQENARRWLRQLDSNLDVAQPIGRLSVAQQQLVEIAKALSLNADLIIMDEPSATLAEQELSRLFAIISLLKQQGVTIIYISHRLQEIFQIADRVTVLKDGQHMATLPVSQTTPHGLIRLMVGRTLDEAFPPRGSNLGEELLTVRHLSRKGVLHDINLSLHRGEILGIAGLVGSGRTELVRAILGADPIDTGEVVVKGRRLQTGSPFVAIKAGLALVPEDRKTEGLALGLSVRQNIALPSLDQRQFLGVVRQQEERRTVEAYIGDLQIRTPSPEQPVQLLSGGNQQKVVLAKWLATEPDVIILDEPTRGIDVGARAEIYAITRRLANEGKGIIVVSSELPEVLGLSDRILVLCEGRVVGELRADEASEERIMTLACGAVGPKVSRAVSPHMASERAAGWAREAFSSLRKAFGPAEAIPPLYWAVLALFFIGLVVSDSFGSTVNLQNIIRQVAVVGILGIGQTFVIISGGVDLSVGAAVALVAVLTASLMNGRPELILPLVIFGVALGAFVGLINGLSVVRLRVPPFIATLAVALIVHGTALVYTKLPIGRIAPEYRFLANGQLGPVPFALVFLAIALAAGYVVLRKTPFGNHIYAVGGSADIAHLSGINVRRVQTAAYVISGMTAGLAGLYLASRMGVGDPMAGPGMEFDAITAVIVGGTSFAGGQGGLGGTIGGALLVGVLNNIMNLLNVNTWYQQVVKGLVILLAMLIYRQQK